MADAYIDHRVALIISKLESVKLNKKFEKLMFMKEGGRKIFLYDSFCQDPLNWNSMKKHKRSFLMGAKVVMKCTEAGVEAQDTLQVVKDTYLQWRTERQPDHLSEDILCVLVPGTMSDNPTNETLNSAWRSLKALGNKHVGPKVGVIRMNSSDLMQQVYTRGCWNRTPDHHIVFTYQSLPKQSGGGRKRMKYLMEGASHADTYFNAWPVPIVPIAQMMKVTQAIHDEIFMDDQAQDSGAEDGSLSAAVADLGDKLIPFPREMSDKLTREMIHVWEVDTGVIFNPGSGCSLLAFILENKRAVGIVKNKAHREVVKDQLLAAVKTLNLAADTRPPKPGELTMWEGARGRPPPTKPPAPPAASAAGVYTPAKAGAPGPSMPSLPPLVVGAIPVAAAAPAASAPPAASAAGACTLAAAGGPQASLAGLSAFGASALR